MSRAGLSSPDEFRVRAVLYIVCDLLDYRVFLSSLVTQEVDDLPRGLKSAFSLRQQASASSYHALPITSLLRAVVDDLRSVGKHGKACVPLLRFVVNYCTQCCRYNKLNKWS